MFAIRRIRSKFTNAPSIREVFKTFLDDLGSEWISYFFFFFFSFFYGNIRIFFLFVLLRFCQLISFQFNFMKLFVGFNWNWLVSIEIDTTTAFLAFLFFIHAIFAIQIWQTKRFSVVDFLFFFRLCRSSLFCNVVASRFFVVVVWFHCSIKCLCQPLNFTLPLSKHTISQIPIIQFLLLWERGGFLFILSLSLSSSCRFVTLGTFNRKSSVHFNWIRTRHRKCVILLKFEVQKIRKSDDSTRYYSSSWSDMFDSSLYFFLSVKILCRYSSGYAQWFP